MPRPMQTPRRTATAMNTVEDRRIRGYQIESASKHTADLKAHRSGRGNLHWRLLERTGRPVPSSVQVVMKICRQHRWHCGLSVSVQLPSLIWTDSGGYGS